MSARGGVDLHASLHAADGSERQMLFEALDGVQPQTDLLVLDRGYPGNALAAALPQTQRHFCWRVDATGWTCVRQVPARPPGRRHRDPGGRCRDLRVGAHTLARAPDPRRHADRQRARADDLAA